MKNTQNTTSILNYKYGLYINYKAFNDYHISNNLDDKYFKIIQCNLMAFIVAEFHKNHKMPHRMIKNERYVMMNSDYILDNLIFLKIKSSMLKKYLVPLKANGLIKVYVENRKDRFINVSKQLINLYYSMDISIRPTNYLEHFRPDLWKDFKNEWELQFKDKKSFKLFIDNFNDNRDIKGYPNNVKDINTHLKNAAEHKLFGKLKYEY